MGQARLGVVHRVLSPAGRAWRTAATLLCFAVFMGGSFLVSFLALPLCAVPGERRRRRRFGKALIHFLFGLFLGLMRGLGVLDLEVDGLEDLQRPGLFVIANHPTLIDFVVLAAVVRRADCLVKSSLERHWAMRWPLLLAGYIPNDRGQETLDLCRASLDSGNSIVVFPEGTRTPAGALPDFKRGAAQLAVRCGRAVTPVLIDFPASNLEKNGAWYLAPARKPRMRMSVLPSVDSASVLARHRGEASLASRALTVGLQQRFHEVLRRERT